MFAHRKFAKLKGLMLLVISLLLTLGSFAEVQAQAQSEVGSITVNIKDLQGADIAIGDHVKGDLWGVSQPIGGGAWTWHHMYKDAVEVNGVASVTWTYAEINDKVGLSANNFWFSIHAWGGNSWANTQISSPTGLWETFIPYESAAAAASWDVRVITAEVFPAHYTSSGVYYDLDLSGVLYSDLWAGVNVTYQDCEIDLQPVLSAETKAYMESLGYEFSFEPTTGMLTITNAGTGFDQVYSAREDGVGGYVQELDTLGDGVVSYDDTNKQFIVDIDYAALGLSEGDTYFVNPGFQIDLVNSTTYSDLEANAKAGYVRHTLDPLVVVAPVHIGETGYFTIQSAINAASAGDIIEVADGTYNYVSEGEPAPDGLIKVNKPVTIKAAEDGNDIRPVIDGTGFNGVFKIWHSTFSGGEVVIEGFEIIGDATTSIAITAAMCDGTDPTKITIRDNVFHGMVGGVDFWGSASFCDAEEKRVRRVEITGNTFYDLGVEGSQFGFGIYLEGLADWTAAESEFAAIVESNLFYDIVNGAGATDYGVGIAITSPDVANSEAVNANLVDNTFEQTVQVGFAIQSGDVSEANIVHNQFNDAWMYVVDADISNGPVDASPNWWGSIAGPAEGQIVGNVVFTSWCGDEECTTLLPAEGEIDLTPEEGETLGAEEIQNAINNAPAGTTIIIPQGAYRKAGAFKITKENIKVVLADGTVIQNSSPCFEITANGVTVTAGSLGSAVCVPTGGSNGIDVTAGLSDITIEGIEIDGADGADGINFAGAVTNVAIRDMFIHDLDGDGIDFVASPSGTVEIKGNLFLNNAGLGINNEGSGSVDATYNAWGDVAGPTGPEGDGVSANVTYDPWTHVDLYMESSGTATPDEVAVSGQITYTVYANLENVTGADFTLKYPPASLTYMEAATVLSGAFDTETLTSDPSAGTLHFEGSQSGAAISGEAVALFEVTFKATTPGAYTLDLDELADIFTMALTSGSTNIYATALADRGGEVKGEYQYIFPIFYR